MRQKANRVIMPTCYLLEDWVLYFFFLPTSLTYCEFFEIFLTRPYASVFSDYFLRKKVAERFLWFVETAFADDRQERYLKSMNTLPCQDFYVCSEYVY